MQAAAVCPHPSHYWAINVVVTCRHCARLVYRFCNNEEIIAREGCLAQLSKIAFPCDTCKVPITGAFVTVGDTHAHCTTCGTRFHPPKLRLP